MHIKFLTIVLTSIFLISCSITDYQRIKVENNKIFFIFNEKISSETKLKIRNSFVNLSIDESSNSISVEIINYDFKDYTIYAGGGLRALEIEVSSNLEVIINNDNTSKVFTSRKRFNSNELNPLADSQMAKFIEKELINDLMSQLIFEVNIIDM